jgi:hypothetical protein
LDSHKIEIVGEEMQGGTHWSETKETLGPGRGAERGNHLGMRPKEKTHGNKTEADTQGRDRSG